MDENKNTLSRAALRYLCYAKREQGKADQTYKKLYQEIEALPNFDGWQNFAITWDFVTEGGEKKLVRPLILKDLLISENEAWDRKLNILARKANRPKGKIVVSKPGKN